VRGGKREKGGDQKQAVPWSWIPYAFPIESIFPFSSIGKGKGKKKKGRKREKGE